MADDRAKTSSQVHKTSNRNCGRPLRQWSSQWGLCTEQSRTFPQATKSENKQQRDIQPDVKTILQKWTGKVGALAGISG